jgi:hypothetical protein
VLYASLLTNVGVRCAFLDVPSHIFLMFDTGIHARDKEVLGVDPSLLVEHEASLWVPVETTCLGQPFNVAWQRGAELVHTWEKTDRFAIVDLEEARQRYEAAVAAARLPKGARGPSVDSSLVADYIGRDLAQLRAMRRDYMQRTYFERLADRADVPERLQLARVYYINRDYSRARHELEQVPAGGRGAAYWNNLGNLQIVQETPQAAVASYSQAKALDGQDPGIALNLGLALQLAQSVTASQIELAAAVRGAGGIASAIQLLGLRPSGVELPPQRQGESIALEQANLARIEALLREAVAAVPVGVRKENSLHSLPSADSLAIVDRPVAADSLMIPVPAAESSAAGRQGPAAIAPAKVPTVPGGSRGGRFEATSIAEVLYWKNS